MKKIASLLLICLTVIIPEMVQGRSFSCKQYDLIKLQKIASNITYTYDYVERPISGNNFSEVTFDITISNLDTRVYLFERVSEKTYSTQNKEIIITNVKPGTSLEFSIYANDYGCNGEELLLFFINVPNYNKYYNQEICQEYPNNKLCNKWTLVNSSYEEFVKKVLKSEKVEEEQIEQIKQNKTFQDYFVEVIAFLDEYKFIIFGTMIIIPLIGIIRIKKVKKKDEFDLK